MDLDAAKFQTPKGPNLFHNHSVNIGTALLTTPDNDRDLGLSSNNKGGVDSSMKHDGSTLGPYRH